MEGNASKNVDVAVKFLQNSNVRNSPYSKKLEFLKNKGLSQQEIEEAVKRSGTDIKQGVIDEPKKSKASKKDWSFGEILRYSILGTSVLAAANYAYKAYILPYMVHELKDDRRIEELLKAVQQMKDNADQNSYELNGTLKALQTLLQQQSLLLKSIDKEMPNSISEANKTSLQELKSELSSIKSIILGRKQFAAAPSFSIPPPSIPAWQRATSDTSDVKENSREDLEVTESIVSNLSDEQENVIPSDISTVEEDAAVPEATTTDDIESTATALENGADGNVEEVKNTDDGNVEENVTHDSLKANQVLVVADICPTPISNVIKDENVLDLTENEEKPSSELQDSIEES